VEEECSGDGLGDREFVNGEELFHGTSAAVVEAARRQPRALPSSLATRRLR
jgi:hypothetical protein